jgi:hypothetical protein
MISMSQRDRTLNEKKIVSPYKIHFSDERIAAIMAKIETYDWDQLPDAGGWSAGVGIDDLKRLVAYWRHTYDWRKVERRLNQLPNFTTEALGKGYSHYARKCS